MADAINLPETDDGQSIPPALAASPAPRKPRVKASKPVESNIVTKAPKTPRAAKTAAPEPVVAAVEAVAPGPEPVTSEPDTNVAPQPEPVAPEPVVSAAPEPAPEPLAAPVTASPVSTTPTAAVPADRKKDTIMATTIDNVTNQTAKAQAFFADANVRAKDAMAKSAKLFEEATAFGKGNVEALVESSKIAAKGMETFGQDAAEYGRKSFEEATAAFKTLATVKSPTEFLKLHSDYVRASFDSLVAETSRSTEQALKLAGEVAQPISNRFAVAAEKMKPAV